MNISGVCMGDNDKPTDWKEYYQNRTVVSKCSAWLCAKTLFALFRANRLCGTAEVQKIIELGGGNSALYKYIRKFFPNARIVLIDKEAFNESSFCKQSSTDVYLECKVEDILTQRPENSGSADLVFSIGLIEHFSSKERAIMIKRHFEHCRPGGIVLISFPTPTFAYRVVRCLMEKLNLWLFHDERPLQTWEVASEMERYGTKIDEKQDFRMGLTQKILLYKKLI